MNQPPAGTVTFLFTDIEGSTKLWQQYPDKMEAALKQHHAILNDSIATHGGYVFQIVGDAFCAAFSSANDGLEAAVKAQRSLTNENWGETGALRVRMALHTGLANLQPGEFISGEYVSGMTLSRTSRLLSAGHGGQILLSLATAELVRDHLSDKTTLRDLGSRRLKDLIRPEQIFQVVTPDLPCEFAPLKTLDVHPHNLPVQLTSFIGREKEMGEIKKLLAGTHLLTLTGIGGTGKTRLALQVAADLIDEYPGGVWLVELAPVPDPELLDQTVASVLGVHLQPECQLSELLIKYVRDKQLLLILDNCEHVVEASAYIANLLLRSAPNLKIIATSRVNLNLAGEVTYPVPPLTIPQQDQAIPMPALTQYEAVRLFIERAIAVKPTFNVTNENAPAVAQICTHLDGIPLAIELAAARVRHLSPEQISARLGDRFSLLTGGNRTALPHHQTLRAAIDWSYDLLNKSERTMFNRLAVFAGSFSLEAAQAVCTEPDEKAGSDISHFSVLDLVSSLLDHSLISLQERKDETRYFLLETVRQYAMEKLQASGEMISIQDRHLEFFLQLALQAELHIYRWEPEWFARYELEYDNLRSAMEHAIGTNLEAAIQMGKSFNTVAQFSNQRSIEEFHWAERIFSLTENWPASKLRAWAIWMYGDIACALPEKYDLSHELLDAGLKMARQLGDKKLVAYFAQSISALCYFESNWEQCLKYSEQYLIAANDYGDPLHISWALGNIGFAKYYLGDTQTAFQYLDQSFTLARQEKILHSVAWGLQQYGDIVQLVGDTQKAIALLTESAELFKQNKLMRFYIYSLFRLGRAELQIGHIPQARDYFEEFLTINCEYRLDGQEWYFLGMAGIAAALQQDEYAAQLFGLMLSMIESKNDSLSDISHKVFDPLIASVHSRLGDVEFKRLWDEGSRLSMEQAIELAKQVECP